jgi:endonuclease III
MRSDMARSHPDLGQVLDVLENLYGPQTAAGPTDPYEMILLKKHGQEICKRLTPRCEICPVTGHCAYLRAKAVD